MRKSNLIIKNYNFLIKITLLKKTNFLKIIFNIKLLLNKIL